jgi:nucleoid DNA-binding protein
MILADLITRIEQKTGIHKKEIAGVLRAFFLSLRVNLRAGEEIKIKKFGRFGFKKRAPRRCRNLRANVSVDVPEHLVVHFFPCKQLKQGVKESEEAMLKFNARHPKKD